MLQTQWQAFIAQFAALSRRQRLDSVALLRGTPPGLALDTGCQAHPVR